MRMLHGLGELRTPGKGRHRRGHPAGPGEARRGRLASGVDPKSLAAALARRIDGEVRFDDGSRALYALDGSNYRQVPIGVVVPRSIEDVVETVRLCREHDAPVLSRGGGTSLAGQCCNVAVVIDWSKYLNRVIDIDPQRRIARVQPGVVLDDLRKLAVRRHGLTFGPDPATHDHCTLGGMLGNNSCGIHAQMAGRTSDNVHSLDVLTYEGQHFRVGPTPEEELELIIRGGGARGLIYQRIKALRDRYAEEIRRRFPRIPRRVSGYNLVELLPESGFNVARALVGSEGTLVTIVQAELKLVPEPKGRSLLVLGYEDVFHAGDDIPKILEHHPIGLEGLDDELVFLMQMKDEHLEAIQQLPPGKGWLLVEFGGESQDESEAKARDLISALRAQGKAPTMKLYEKPEEAQKVWEIRESGLGATARHPKHGETFPGWEDAAVPPEKVGQYLRAFHALLQRHGYDASLYGHFGQGCIHCRINFDVKTAGGVAKYRAFVNEAADLVVSLGGSLSGEHGDGQSRAELLPKMFGDQALRAMREFKQIWDPRNRMNPGKVVDPYGIVENLRFGPQYAPWRPKTVFEYPTDKFSFVNAAERCVGVGKCRREGGGVMCPSYMVTREEMHSTRGRAHLLHEMLLGDPVADAWRSHAVKEALDLCLACKGCKSDCPVNVDMATYKAEFFSHYYGGRLRPRSAYAFGLIMYWAQLGGRLPGLANLITQTRGLKTLAKKAAGMPLQREIPTFGSPCFQKRVRARPCRNVGATKVMLYPDTFNNWFHPETAEAALDVLEAAGFDVVVPRRFACCGRPLYDYGMLDTAKRLLRKVLKDFRQEIRGGMPFVVLEPSCAAVFRDELPELFPHDMDAQRLKAQTFTLGEFLMKKAPSFDLPTLERTALVHGHCHHRSVLDYPSDQKALARLGLEINESPSGCCGMAGSFGFERDKYEVSVKCGERVLLPRVRELPDDALIVTDGFSCKTQIAQGTGREALHLAQLIKMGMLEGPRGPAGSRPESRYADNGGRAALRRARRATISGAALGAAGALVGLAVALPRRNRKHTWLETNRFWELPALRG